MDCLLSLNYVAFKMDKIFRKVSVIINCFHRHLSHILLAGK